MLAHTHTASRTLFQQHCSLLYITAMVTAHHHRLSLPQTILGSAAAYMNRLLPKQVSKEVAARYPINVFLTYSKAGVLESSLESLPHNCTPAMLGTMLQTGLHNLGDVSPFGVRMLVRTCCALLCCALLSEDLACYYTYIMQAT